MSMGRIALASLVGGIIVFAWGAVSHMALPIGEMGIKELPGEEAIVGTLKGTLQEPGFYLFPGFAGADPKSKEANDALGARYKAGPRGVVVYDPTGEEMMSPRQLGIEFAGGLMGAAILAMVLVGMKKGVVAGAVVGAALGVFSWASLDVSYWNWYRFPTAFALGSLIDQTVGWFLAGLGMSAILKPGKGAV